MQLPSSDRIRELLAYSAITGELTWKVYRNPQAVVGQLAGSITKNGYRVIGIDNKVMLAHRIAWLLQYGDWPKNHLDHINHDRDDNRSCNLREVSREANMMNKSKCKRNSSGYTGVYQSKEGNWKARISANKKQINLGTFLSINDAIAARKSAEVAFNFHSNHGL